MSVELADVLEGTDCVLERFGPIAESYRNQEPAGGPVLSGTQSVSFITSAGSVLMAAVFAGLR